MTLKDCRDCTYSGMDMDMTPYCVHPNVLNKHTFGLSLTSLKIVDFCPAPEHPLFVSKDKKNEK